MSKKVIKLTESQLVEIIEKVISESKVNEDLGGMEDSHPIYGEMNPDDLLSYVKKGDIRLKKVKPNRFEDEVESIKDGEVSLDDEAHKNEMIKRRLERQHQFESKKRR